MARLPEGRHQLRRRGRWPRFYGMPARRPGIDARRDHQATSAPASSAWPGSWPISSMTAARRPTLRGRWILINLLCSHPEPPPPDVPELEDVRGTRRRKLNVRESARAAPHATRPVPAATPLFDPYGLALEQFDAIGKYRTTYADGTPIDASTTLPPIGAYPTASSFSGLDGLADAVTPGPEVHACVGEKLLHLRPRRADGRRPTSPTSQTSREEWLAQADAQHAPPDPRAGADRTFPLSPRRDQVRTCAMNRRLSRRTLLRGAGVALTLPWLESLAPREPRERRPPSFRKRFMPIYLAERRRRVLAAGDQRAAARPGSCRPMLEPFARAQGEDDRAHQPGERLGVQRRRSAQRRAEPRPAAGRLADLRRPGAVQRPARRRRGQRHLGRSGHRAARRVQGQDRARLDAGRACRRCQLLRRQALLEQPQRLVEQRRPSRCTSSSTRSRSSTGSSACARQPDPDRHRRDRGCRSAWPSTRACSTRCSRTRTRTRARLGASDQRRMDEFLDSVRAVEKRVTGVSPAWAALRCTPIARADHAEGRAVRDRAPPDHRDLQQGRPRRRDERPDRRWPSSATSPASSRYMLEDERSEFTYDHVTKRTFTARARSKAAAPAPSTTTAASTAGRTTFATITWWNVGKVADALPQARRHRRSARHERARQHGGLFRRLHAGGNHQATSCRSR